MTGAPPSLVGGDQLRCTAPSAATPVRLPGIPGVVAGTTGAVASEAGPTPALLVAVTVKLYGVPFAKLSTLIGLPGPVVVAPLGDARTVYDVIAAPPLFAGGVKLTVAREFDGDAETFVGAPGGEIGCITVYTAVVIET